MNKIKNILFAGALTLGAFGTITYTACNKDECKDVVCNNGGTCVSGSCSCPSGYQGTRCDSLVSATYAGDYKGTGTDNAGGTYTNWTLSFSAPAATSMTLTLKNSAGATQLTFPITLSFNGTGTTAFTVTSTTVGSFTYTGSGTISTTTASLSLNQAGSPNLVFTFNNFIRQ